MLLVTLVTHWTVTATAIAASVGPGNASAVSRLPPAGPCKGCVPVFYAGKACGLDAEYSPVVSKVRVEPGRLAYICVDVGAYRGLFCGSNPHAN